MNIPRDAPKSVQQALRELDARLSKWEDPRLPIDLHGRRVVNAGPSQNPGDYITRGEADQRYALRGATPGSFAQSPVITPTVIYYPGGASSGGDETPTNIFPTLYCREIRPITGRRIMVPVGPALASGEKPGLVLDFSGIQPDGQHHEQQLFIGSSALGPLNRKEISMGENDGVLTITGNRVADYNDFQAPDFRIGEPMGSGISFGGENLSGTSHYIYGGVTPGSIGEQKGHICCARLTSQTYRYAFYADENARFGFRYGASVPFMAITHTGATRITGATDRFGRNLSTLHDVIPGHIVRNHRSGAWGIVTRVSTKYTANDTIEFSGGLKGGTDNQVRDGDVLEVYQRGVVWYDFAQRGADSNFNQIPIVALLNTDLGAGFELGYYSHTRGVLSVRARTRDASGNPLGVLESEPGVIALESQNNIVGCLAIDPYGNFKLYDSLPDPNDYTTGSTVLVSPGYTVMAAGGTGSIKMEGPTPRTNEGWLIIRLPYGGTGYLPYWLEIY